MRIHILKQDFQGIRIVDGDVAVATRHDLAILILPRPGETVHRTGIDRKFGYDPWAGGAEVNSPDLDLSAVGPETISIMSDVFLGEKAIGNDHEPEWLMNTGSRSSSHDWGSHWSLGKDQS